MTIKRPLMWMLLFLTAGIAAGRYADGSFVVAAVLVMCCVGVVLLLYRPRVAVVLLLLPMLAAAGFLSVGRVLKENPAVTEGFATEQITLTGRVKSVIVSANGNTSGLLFTESLGAGVQVLVRLPEGMSVSVGQALTVTGKLQRLDAARNPGAFDEFVYWRTRGAAAKLYADEVAVGDVRRSVFSVLSALREKVDQAYYNILPAKEAGVLSAMITGDRTGIDEEIGELYRDAGIFHIIAVSGTHMTILAAAIGFCLQKLGLPRRQTGLVSFGVVVMYCIFTGASPAAVRAVIMFGIMALAPLLHRDTDAASAAGLAAMVLLLYNPLYLWDAGFLYSFAAVFALSAGTAAVERIMLRLLQGGGAPALVLRAFQTDALRKAVASTVAVFLATWPVTAWFFYKVSFVGIFANLLILPTVTVTTVSGFLAGIVGLFSVSLGRFCAGAAYVMLQFYENLCRAAVAIPFANVLTGRPPIWILGLYIAALAIVLAAQYHRGAAYARMKKAALAAVGLCVAGGLWLAVSPKPLTVVMLDVGQGDATVLSKGGQAVIWDGGGNVMRGLGDNTGMWTVMPYLRYLGISQAEAVLTHPDADHALGIIEAIDAGVVRRLYIPLGMYAAGSAGGDAGEPSNYHDTDGLAGLVLARAEANGVAVIPLQAGDSFGLIDGVSMFCLHPQGGMKADNNGSIVCRVDYGGASFLLTGDVEAEGERLILDIYGAAVDADILKLAHHGSRSSSTEEFLRAVSPDAAVASAGRNSRYGHPSPEVAERLEGMGVPMVVTAESGAVIFTTYGRTIRMQTMLGDKR